VEATWPIVHEAHTGSTVDANGYTVPAAWAAPVDRLVFGWQPELVDVQVNAQANLGYQMRVTNRQEVMVDDIRPYKLGDRIALGATSSELTSDTPRHRVDQMRDLSHGPFHTTAFGPAPGTLIVELISG
jgi:hypothetical protein